MITQKGLGLVDCSGFWNTVLNPQCSGGTNYWSNLFGFSTNSPVFGSEIQQPPTLAKGADASVVDYSNPSTLVTGAQENPNAAIQNAITGQTDLNRLSLQDFYSGVDTSNCSTTIIPGMCNTTVLLIAGIGLFGLMWLGDKGARRYGL